METKERSKKWISLHIWHICSKQGENVAIGQKNHDEYFFVVRNVYFHPLLVEKGPIWRRKKCFFHHDNTPVHLFAITTANWLYYATYYYLIHPIFQSWHYTIYIYFQIWKKSLSKQRSILRSSTNDVLGWCKNVRISLR